MEGLRKQRSDSGNNQRDNLLNSLHECDTYKELGKKIKDPEDIVEFDRIQNMISFDDIIKEIVDYRMQLLFEAFEHVGFSKDYILSHANEFHSQKFLSTDSYIFYHYNERLFDICIFSGFDSKDMYSFMYGINGWITYYKT